MVKNSFRAGALLPRTSSCNNARYHSNHSNNSFSAAIQEAVEEAERAQVQVAQASRGQGSGVTHAAAVHTYSRIATATRRGSPNGQANVSSRRRTTYGHAGTRTQSDAPIRPSGWSAHAITYTAARSAARGQDFLDPRLQDILRNPARKSELFPIVTPLKADNWERRIKEAGLEETYGDIPNGIRYGFSHGLDRAQAA
jgi:hypothetical protein